MGRHYVTTPIYYVNDKPHIGHVYTTTLADVLARANRLAGNATFFLTGTDEHAAKVSDAAAEHGLSPQAWADQNAAAFKETFERLELGFDDFIRTSEDRHKSRVVKYVKQLMDSGDVYLGEYTGWYDAGQEEYVPENKAKEYDYISPVNKKPLVKKVEKNYFFKLSSYAEALLAHLETGEQYDVRPEGRKNEIVARIREGLHDVPISRTGSSDWGIKVPGELDHTIYVWIDALMNYLTTVDTDERRHFWPADVHVIGKDILWFHAAIWPAMLLALQKQPGNEWMKLPRLVYAHSFWIREGEKMSKSMGNFVDLAEIDAYREEFGLDALRLFLVTQGPLSAADADFARARFIDGYNTDLANTIGNCFSRVSNMLGKYVEGKWPGEKDTTVPRPLQDAAKEAIASWQQALAKHRVDGFASAGLGLVRAIDHHIQATEPFKAIKEDGGQDKVATILSDCAEALRIASLLLWPVLPHGMAHLWQRCGLPYASQLKGHGLGELNKWCAWGGFAAGASIEKGDPLYPRHTEKGA